MIYKTREDVVTNVADVIFAALQKLEDSNLTLEDQDVIDELERASTIGCYAYPVSEEERREALRRTALIIYCDGIMEEVGQFSADPWGDAILDPVAFEIALRIAVFDDALFVAQCRLF